MRTESRAVLRPMVQSQNSALPVSLYRAEQVRQLDRIAGQEFGIPGIRLMLRAGRAAAELLRTLEVPRKRVLVLCGAGNNGGDGLVLAARLQQRGSRVQVACLKSPAELQGDAALARDYALEQGTPLLSLAELNPDDQDLLVDALLGTGFQGALRKEYLDAIGQLNAAHAPVLSLDLPSGLDADTGTVAETAVRARWTMSFGALKCGLFTGVGPEYAGAIYCDALGIPAAALQGLAPVAQRLVPGRTLDLLPPRPRHAHKGDFGHVLVIGGNPGMSGAVLLAGQAALRCGAGLVSVATHPEHAPWLSVHCPELMVHGIASGPDIDGLLQRATVLVVGPGLGRNAWAEQMLQQARDAGMPTVWDADALRMLCAMHEGALHEGCVLTPHPGEAAALLGMDKEVVQANRFASATELSRRFGAVAVLKGAGTLVCDGERTFVCEPGNPGMATGGMGDVLSGVIGALLAQGCAPLQAACLGVWAHACAGDEAARDGERGLLASDLFAGLRRVLNGPGRDSTGGRDS